MTIDSKVSVCEDDSGISQDQPIETLSKILEGMRIEHIPIIALKLSPLLR